MGLVEALGGIPTKRARIGTSRILHEALTSAADIIYSNADERLKGEFVAYGSWIAQARPIYRWDAKHFQVMQEALDEVTLGTCRRVFFGIPIRHGKTEHNSIGYGSYRLERDPKTRIIVVSYNQKQADKLSREIRKLVKARGVQISKDRDTSSEWETTAGGGVRAVGTGAGVASLNADLIIIDDPIGSRDDAESPAHRDFVWDFLTNDVFARTEPHTAVLMSMSRWHQDDPAGRLQERFGDKWKFIDLPGRAEENDPLGRPIDFPLWPEKRGDEWLTEKRLELGEYGFASLIQGRPRPRSGGMFKWEWWKIVKEEPVCRNYVRYWDLAGTESRGDGHDPDYTVGALLGKMLDGRTAVLDIERFRHSVAMRDYLIESQCEEDLKKYRGKGRIVWWFELEAGIAGKDRMTALVRRCQNLGITVYVEVVTGKKEIRAEPFASKAEVGNVVLLEAAWNDPFRSELADFPTGNHDDQADSASGASTKLDLMEMMIGRTFTHRV